MPLPVQLPEAPLPTVSTVTEVATTGKDKAEPGPVLAKTQTFKGSTVLARSKLKPMYEDVKKMTVRAWVPSSDTASKYHQSKVVALIGYTRGLSAPLAQDVNWTSLGPA